MTSKLTREERIQSLYDLKIGQVLNQSDIESIKMLARMALAAMDSEPVYQVFEPSDGRWVDVDDEEEMIRLRSIGGETRTLYTAPPSTVVDSEPVAWQYRVSAGPATGWSLWHDGKGEQYENSYKVERRPLCRHAQPAPERDQVRREHAEWSQATFGNIGPVGPLKHLSKEALEAAEEPGDLSEWADMQFLMWDAQRRAGITDEQITQAMIEKLAVNKQRSWPEPKEGEPRLHIKEQPAPVVPEKATVGEMPFLGTSEGAYVRGWNDCRAAMLQAGNSPAIQDGYVMVPIKPTMEILDEFDSIIDYGAEDSEDAWRRLLAAAPQEAK